MSRQIKFMIVLAGALLACTGLFPAAAQTVVFTQVPLGHFYYSATVQENQTVQLFTGSQNLNGLHLRTVSVACANNFSMVAITPQNNLYTFETCNPTASGSPLSINASGLFLPKGWGLEVSSGTTGGTSGNQVYITYDD